MFKQGVVLLGLVVASVAFGREASTYEIKMDASGAGKQSHSDWGNRANIGGGWTCWSEASMESTEELKDYKGTLKSFDRSETIDTPSSFTTNPTLQTTAVVAHDQHGPFFLKMREKCEECTTYTTTSTDSNGNTTTTTYTDCDYAWVTWQCPIGRQRRESGETTFLSCRVSDESLYYGRPAKVLNRLKQHMKVKATLKGTDERVDLDLCKGRTENRSVVRLRQGAGGHKGENDFVFYVKIGDEKPVEIKSKEGVLNQDISFCPFDSSVNVKVWAVEKDLVFDDKYKPVDPEGLNFQVAGGAQSGSVELHRRSYFGATPKKSVVTVDFIGPSKFQGLAESPLDFGPLNASTTH